jgi:predicted PurR-regulated permease PerM
MSDQAKLTAVTTASYILAAAALLLILHAGLLAALFSGLLVYALVHMLTPVLSRHIGDQRARMISVGLLGALIIAGVSLIVWGAITFFHTDVGSVQGLMRKLADMIDTSRNQMPTWLQEHVPEGADAIREWITDWLRRHAEEAQSIGQMAGRTGAHVLIGMVIGAMAALYDTTTKPNFRPLAAALHDRVANLHTSFHRVVFAQVRIAALNAIFTAIYLLIILPMSGVHLPLAKSLVAITFITGLLPVIGNLISNSIIVVTSLSHSLTIAIVSLLFLILIHKLEYFLNAKIIGSRINSHAWELLAAMLVMEALFGLPGVVAAPVFYAYLKKELRDRGLV